MLVIMGSPDSLDGLANALSPWNEARLVRSVLLVALGDAGGDPLRLFADGAVSKPRSLDEVLGPINWSEVTLVVAALGDAIAHAESVIDTVAPVVGELRRIAPGNARISPALVAIPSRAEQHLDPQWFAEPLRRWSIVAAEDRRDGGSSNELGDEPVRLFRHAAHALISVAHEWSHSPSDVHFVLQETETASPHQARIVRTHSRIIDLGFLVDHVAADVLQPGGSWPNPDITAFEIRSLTAPVAQRIVDNYLSKHDRILGLTPYFADVPERSKLTLWEALKAVVRHVIERLTPKPIDWLDQTVGSVYDRIAAKVEHHDQGAEVRIKRWRELEDGSRGTTVVHQLTAQKLHVEQGAVAPAWEDLQRLAIGLCDGTTMPKDIAGDALHTDGVRLLETDPDRLVPDPLQLPPRQRPKPGERMVRACDPRAFDPVLQGSSTEEDGSGPATVPAEEGPRGVLAEWLEPRRTSLLWMVGLGIAKSLKQARQEAVRPTAQEWQSILEAADEVPDRIRLTRRRFFRWLLVRTILAVGVTVAAFAVDAPDVPTWVRVSSPIVTWMLWVLTLGRGWQRCERRRGEIEGEVERRSARWLDAMGLARVREADAERLERRYGEFLDWAEITGYYLHRPFVPEAERDAEAAAPLEPGSTPAAMSVGIGALDAEGIAGLTQNVRSSLFSPSWLLSHYQQVLVKHLERWRVRHNVSADEAAGRTGHDDTTVAPTSLRLYLLEQARNGTHRGFSSNPMAASLISVLERQPQEQLAQVVVPSEQADLRLGAMSAWTEAGALKSEAIAALRAAVVRVRVTQADNRTGGTGVLIRSGGVVATCWHVVQGADHIEIEVQGQGWYDAEILQAAASDDLALLAVDGVHGLTAVELGNDRALASGSRVHSLGFVHLLEGDPTTTHGQVTSERRLIDHEGQQLEVVQASYPASGGASGSPVCDASGRLVGIHQGGATPPEGSRSVGPMSYFVSVNKVRRLSSTLGFEAPMVPSPAQIALPGQGIHPDVFLQVDHHPDEEVAAAHIVDPLVDASRRRISPATPASEARRELAYRRTGRIGRSTVFTTDALPMELVTNARAPVVPDVDVDIPDLI